MRKLMKYSRRADRDETVMSERKRKLDIDGSGSDVRVKARYCV